MKRFTLEEHKRRFWSRIKVSDTGCWEWQGGLRDGIYGNFSFDYRDERAHRVAWEFSFGQIPNGMLVRHKCDNTICVNPLHLCLGTDQDNADDMVSRGRSARGETASHTKLTEAQVRLIRSIYRRYSRTHGSVALARQFGVTHQSVLAVVQMKGWKYLR